MRKLLYVSFFFLCFHNMQAQEMITSEILQRVLYVKNGTSTGTAFFVTINKKVYIITAKHLFSDSISYNSEIEIEGWQNKSWLKIKGKLLYHENKNIDIAVIDINQENLKEPTYDLSTKGMYVSQECFFLGFPFGFKMDEQIELNNGMPLPFVKKGIISAWVDDTANVFRIFLDGHNNPGFSGGPVVITNTNSKNTKSIVGIVSGYVTDNKVLSSPSGNIINRENSGIVIVYAIKHVYEILDRK